MNVVFSRTAWQLFAPAAGTGKPRGANMEHARGWGTELERAGGALLTLDDARLSGATYLSLLVPPTLAASVNDWEPDAGNSRTVWLLSASVPVNITGIVSGGSGRLLALVNIGAAAITLPHNSASSAGGNRFNLPAAASVVLGTNAGILLQRPALGRWVAAGLAT
jgi:hypothetical protein